MSKKTVKLISRILLLTMLLFVCTATMAVFAQEGDGDDKKVDPPKVDPPKDDEGSSWINKEIATGTNIKDVSLEDTENQFIVMGQSVHSLIKTVLNMVGLIILMFYGVRYWMAGSDSSAKKELKEQGFSYMKGAVLFFGSSFLYDLIVKIVTSF